MADKLVTTKLYNAIVEELEMSAKVLEEQWDKTDPLLEDVERCIIAVGAGDSYAAAIGIEAVDPRVRVFDPLDLLYNQVYLSRFIENNCILIALSVGGRTRSVVALARNYRQRGGDVVAVTANLESPLAREASSTIRVIYGKLASGIGALRHLSMIVAAAKMLGYEKPLFNDKLQVDSNLRREAIYVGLCESFSTAVFTVLKLYEVYGWRTRYEKLEQLLHAPIFTTNYLVFFQSAICNSRSEELLETVRRAEYKVEVIPSLGSNGIDNLVGQGIVILKRIANKVKENGVNEPFYKRHPKLDILTDIIYE